MNKYNCSLVYQKGERVEAKGVTFEKKDFGDFKLSGNLKKEYSKLKSSLDKVNFMSSLLSRGGTNIITGVGGKLPHKKLVSHTGFWKVEGEGVLPKSYFKVISLKDV